MKRLNNKTGSGSPPQKKKKIGRLQAGSITLVSNSHRLANKSCCGLFYIFLVQVFGFSSLKIRSLVFRKDLPNFWYFVRYIKLTYFLHFLLQLKAGAGERPEPPNYRAVDPHSFYSDPDPAVFLNADPYPGPGPA